MNKKYQNYYKNSKKRKRRKQCFYRRRKQISPNEYYRKTQNKLKFVERKNEKYDVKQQARKKEVSKYTKETSFIQKAVKAFVSVFKKPAKSESV